MPTPNASSPQSALDAINEALGVTDAVEDEEELENDDESGDDDDSGDDSDSPDEGDDGEGDDDAEGEGDGDEEGDEEGEQTDEEKAAAAKAAKSEFNADGSRKEPPGKKKPDPINDPIPKDLKQETSDRMRSLIKIAKDVTAERDEVRTNFDTIINGIKASGSSPEQYGEAISWLSLFNSPKVEDRRAAYELVENVADRMATLLGIDRALADPLKGHQDLIDAVKNKTATMEMAKEVARTRNAAKFTGDITNSQRQQQQTQEQARQEHETAKADLNAFDVEMRSKDPLYDAKRKILVPILQESFKTLPKSQWAATYKAAYAKVRVQPKGTSSVANGGKAKNGSQPLRGNKNPAGGQSRAPTSALEAMNAGIARAK